MKISNELESVYRSTITQKLDKKTKSLQFLPKCLEEISKLKTEIELNRGIGRPKEGNTYGKDKHPYGRDPLGNKENEKERKREDRVLNTNAKKLAREYINGISSKKQVLIEKAGMLDEKNLLDDTKI